MKTIALLVAVLAMVGFAAAWDTIDTASYQYTHQMYIQAGSPTSWPNYMTGATSTVTFSAPNPYAVSTDTTKATATGTITNTLESSWANPLGPDGTSLSGAPALKYPSQTDTLTQGGTVGLKTSALDSQDTVPELQASMSKFQNLHFSGVYESVGATFSDSGNVGIQNSKEPENNIMLYESSPRSADPSVYAYGSYNLGGTTTKSGFTEADTGIATTAGLTYDMVNNVKSLSGSVQSYAGFTGGFLANGGYYNSGPTTGSYIQANTGNVVNQVWYSTPFIAP